MDKRLKWFYRISIWLIAILVLSTILVKTIIWPSASRDYKETHQYQVRIRRDIGDVRHTTKLRQKLFNGVDYLLTPAFTLLFVVIAVKLTKMPEIFEEKD